jgi:hypothetical protein
VAEALQEHSMPKRRNQIQSLMGIIQTESVEGLKYKYKVGTRP